MSRGSRRSSIARPAFARRTPRRVSARLRDTLARPPLKLRDIADRLQRVVKVNAGVFHEGLTLLQRDRNVRRLMIHAHAHPALMVGHVVDPSGNRLAQVPEGTPRYEECRRYKHAQSTVRFMMWRS